MTTEVGPSIRASDADRERVASIIAAAAGQGMLTLAEADERLGQVYAARYLSELAPITADLPDGGRALAPADRAARPTAWSAVRSRARSGSGPYIAVYLGWSAMLIAIWAATGAHYFWPIWPMMFFGISGLRYARWARYAGHPAAAQPAAGEPDAAPRPDYRPGYRRGYRHGGYRGGYYRHRGCGWR
ncbi:MAG: hypothetical protein V7637_4290 [Mycobacteriales bacterium]|jgi:hypothetical protein